MSMSAGVHNLPISARPPSTWSRKFLAVIFVVTFDTLLIICNAFQFIFLLPLRLAPFTWSRDLYKTGIRFVKGVFTCILILMSQCFAPTKFVITFETQGKGAFTRDELDHIAVRDESGRVVSLNFSTTKFVLIANHQMYADWWYAWCLLYYVGPHGVHRDVCITLKKRFKWIPVVGWGMQFFDFIFLAQSWASDRKQLATSLSTLGKEAETKDKPFVFILYPEGTLVSRDTRPISKKFADKMGIDDMTNILLPRSTGLHYSLRSLSPRIPDLRLIDLTVVYPGIPYMGYGQSYYTLRSIFLDGIAPPEIHLHVRTFDVKTQVPVGDLSTSDPATLPGQSSDKQMVEVEIPEKEKVEFDLWLRDLWRVKDDMMTHFFQSNSLSPGQKPVVIPLKL